MIEKPIDNHASRFRKPEIVKHLRNYRIGDGAQCTVDRIRFTHRFPYVFRRPDLGAWVPLISPPSSQHKRPKSKVPKQAT